MSLRRPRWLLGLAGVTVLLPLAALLAGKLTLQTLADRRAEAVIAGLPAHGADRDRVIGLARWAAAAFKQSGAVPAWVRYSFYWQHRLVPEPLRLPRGSIDLLRMEGTCSDLSRALEYLYGKAGFEAVQHNLMAPKGAHSAVSVRLGQDWVFLDPFMRVAFQNGGTLMSLPAAVAAAQAGSKAEELVLPLGEGPDLTLYHQLDRIDEGRMNEPFVLNIRLPARAIALGTQNRVAHDVTSAGRALGLGSHLAYIGPRYGREIGLKFQAPGRFRATFMLLQAPDPDRLPRTDAARMVVESNRLILESAGPQMSLDYSRMPWSLDAILRGQSWYDVDQVAFEPLDG